MGQSFVRSSRKSTRVAACKLWMPQNNGMKYFTKNINFKPYQLQLTQHVTKDGRQVSIYAALRTIDRVMLQTVRNELDYRLEICRVVRCVATAVSAVSMIRGPSSYRGPNMYNYNPNIGFSFLKRGTDGILIQGPLKTSYSSAYSIQH
ncbi:hypothetical protein TNCV_3585651 [Trichonephila clavipes]|nr:hypothetical protein TNCV_3585651 [Trichonephila clavipes]